MAFFWATLYMSAKLCVISPHEIHDLSKKKVEISPHLYVIYVFFVYAKVWSWKFFEIIWDDTFTDLFATACQAAKQIARELATVIATCETIKFSVVSRSIFHTRLLRIDTSICASSSFFDDLNVDVTYMALWVAHRCIIDVHAWRVCCRPFADSPVNVQQWRAAIPSRTESGTQMQVISWPANVANCVVSQWSRPGRSCQQSPHHPTEVCHWLSFKSLFDNLLNLSIN